MPRPAVRPFPALTILTAALSFDGNTAPTPPPTPVTVQLSWTHQAEFAGFYAADQNGYYAEEGLAVAFVEGGPGVNSYIVKPVDCAQFAESVRALGCYWLLLDQPPAAGAGNQAAP